MKTKNKSYKTDAISNNMDITYISLINWIVE